MQKSIIVVLLSIFFSGCGDSNSKITESVEVEPKGIVVTSKSYGDKWPFTVNGGTLDCIKGSAAIFKVEGISYQLNGVATSLGYKAIDTIWKDNPAIPGAKVNLGPMIELALEQC